MKRYETVHLPVAAYVHCRQLLKFIGVRKAGKATIVFEFADAEEKGKSLEIDFEQGRAIVDARAFASSERFLKSKMHRALRPAKD